jgi:hypothetical protein
MQDLLLVIVGLLEVFSEVGHRLLNLLDALLLVSKAQFNTITQTGHSIAHLVELRIVTHLSQLLKNPKHLFLIIEKIYC